MNQILSLDPTVRQLNDCGGCEGITIEAPLEISNRPGLSTIEARIGTHSRFKESLLALLSSQKYPQLQALSTRDDGDFTIALLDAWAVLADIITFYQERIAHENYLRTAVERRSLRELGRLLGYELRPGVAASAPLAFTLEPSVGAPASSSIAIGTRVQSLPGPGQKPQTFETVEAIEARPEWNAVRPRVSQPQPITAAMKSALLTGLAVNVKQSDSIFILAGNAAADHVLKRVRSVSTDPTANTTRLVLDDDPPDPPPFLYIYLLNRPPAPFITSPLIFNNNAINTVATSGVWSHANFLAQTKVQKWSMPAVKLNLKFQFFTLFMPVDKGVFALRQKASVFGHNAPYYYSIAPSQRLGQQVTDSGGAVQSVAAIYPTSWEGRTLADESPTHTTIDLDTTYSRVVVGSYVVIETPTSRAFLKVTDVIEMSRNSFTLNAKVTRLKVTSLSGDAFSSFILRQTTVFLESDRLPLAQLPIVDPVDSAPISLEGPYPELKVNQRVVLTGEATDLSGVTVSESLTIADAKLIDGFTWLTFSQGPLRSYVRKSVTFNANVALATHGETVEEVLGSGNSVSTFQRFTLRQPPLTFVSAKNPTGAASTLEVWVNSLLWTEVPSFFGLGPDDRVYLLRHTEEGTSYIQFGDGRNGARLPTGSENVRVRYRKGMGSEGLVDAGQLTLIQSRPLGVRSVTNPVSASGMADRETVDDARINAPLTVMTLDRIVSLQDYGDFARAFSGVAKARSELAWNNMGRRVFVTVAGPDGALIQETDDLYANLLSAMLAAGDSQVPLRVQTFSPAFFTLGGTVRAASDHLEAEVFSAIDVALRSAFSFSAREFSQPVAHSEVLAVIHGVSGVVAVDLDFLHRVDLPVTLENSLPAAGPRTVAGNVLGAELLILDARPLALSVIKPA